MKFEITGHENILELLFKNGAKVDEKDDEGRTPLELSVANGNIILGSIFSSFHLLKPFFCFTQLGNQKIMNLLIKNGASLNATGSDGKTLLHIAAETGNNRTINHLNYIL